VGDHNEEHQDNYDENLYTPLGRNEEEYDTILRPSSPVVIVNRPPAPTPRPDSLPTPENKTPFIAQGLNFLLRLRNNNEYFCRVFFCLWPIEDL